MFEDIKDIEDVAYIGINPVKSIVTCIEMNDHDKEMVCNLANGAIGILEDLYKCVERLSIEQNHKINTANGLSKSADNGLSHVSGQ